MSALENKLKAIIEDHPDTRIHPHSPSGPHVRAVMWTASPDLMGQAFQESGGRWVVRVCHLPTGQVSQVVHRPADVEGIPASIDLVLAVLRDRH